LSWLLDDWKLKLLAAGLAVLMLGAVAFSQNPPTSKPLNVGIAYSIPAGIILISPPTQTTVTVSGLADLVTAANSTNVVTTADISKASPGSNVRVNLVPKTVLSGVTVQTTPIVLNIDKRAVVKLPVDVRTPQGTAPGWQITKMETRCPDAPCSVSFDGPVSLETNLRAYADFPVPVAGSYDFPSQPVTLEQNGTPLNLTKLKANTQPQASLDISTVNIHIEAKSGTSTRQVAVVDSPPSSPPPNCYRVTDITVDPVTIILTGSPDALSKVTRITLPAVDLSGRTSDATFRVTIPFPSGVTGSPTIAKVTYAISQNPNCATPT
jgi:YbbR domain-containing protein